MALYDQKYERIPQDRYETPEWVTRAGMRLLGRGRHKIWEPCCASGKMSRVLMDAGYDVFSSDIAVPLNARGIYPACNIDFMQAKEMPEGCDGVFSNSPYSIAPAFVRHALKLTHGRQGFVILLLPMNWDAAATRPDLFEHCPAFAEKMVLRRRIVWFERPPEPGKKRVAPKENHAWYRWDWLHHGAPTISYAPERKPNSNSTAERRADACA